MRLNFPDDFYWGSATSAHQVEGNNHNDWTEWEKSELKIQNLKLKIQDENFKKSFPPHIFSKWPTPLDLENYISGRACDHYNRFKEDFDIAKSLGHNAHRFSIEWSRIEPEEGKFDEAEIEHYRQVISALKERGIEPFVTLWHWTNPIWFAKKGGWLNKDAPKYFERYVDKITLSLKDVNVKFWITLNEPNVYVGKSYIQGNFPPQGRSFWRANKVFKNLIRANNQAYSLMHKIAGDKIKIGSTHFLVAHLPYNPKSFLDKISVKFLDYIRNFRPIRNAREHHDFIGIDYYHLERIEFSLRGRRWFLFNTHVSPDNLTEFGWEIYPEGIYKFLMRLKKYNKPIYITENGIADARDEKRAKFIKEHLKWVHKAISEGVDIRGYFYWSLLDNFEWDKGFWPRFGLVEVDYRTLERKIRNSALKYKKICKENSLDMDF